MEETCLYFNKNLTSMYMDKFKCSLWTLCANLYYYDFGYYCMAPLALIAVISIFGKFKGNYRWFILHQIIWDLVISYDYSCDNPIKDGVKQNLPCFYNASRYFDTSNSTVARLVSSSASSLIEHTPFSALFLLSMSRFLALYFPFFYDRITQGAKLVWIFVIFNFVILIFDIAPIFTYFLNERTNEIKIECSYEKNLSMCKNPINDPTYHFYKTIGAVFVFLRYFKPCLFLILSTIATMLILWKIAKQAIFQSKHNRKDFSTSIRIAIVLGLQIVTNGFVFFLDFFGHFIHQLVFQFNLPIIVGKTYSRGYERLYTLLKYWDLRLPDWLDGHYGLSNQAPHQMIKQFRILFEAFIILFIMTGYRETIIKSVKHVHQMFRKMLKLKTKVASAPEPTLF